MLGTEPARSAKLTMLGTGPGLVSLVELRSNPDHSRTVELELLRALSLKHRSEFLQALASILSSAGAKLCRTQLGQPRRAPLET